MSAADGGNGGAIFQVGDEIPLNKITSEGLIEEEVALLRSNGSLKRRSVSRAHTVGDR
jgi:hypothetical protein